MLYFPLGSLKNLHNENSIAQQETIDLFFQALNTLRYLHSRDVMYRDLISKNILVKSRFPLSIKLADFGLANNKPDLKIFCGTREYIASEIYLGKSYTVLVDLWLLEIIIFQYIYSLPKTTTQKRGQSI